MTGSGTPVAPVRITICTHNGEEWLPHNLAALAPQAARFGIPVDIIDSGSKPASAGAISDLARSHGVSYVRVDQPGLSVARNAGLARCTEEWIAYLDDDAVAGADYADALLRAIGEAGPNVALIGGRVLPLWPDERPHGSEAPNDIPSRWRNLLSIIDDDRVYDSTDSPLAVGANIILAASPLRHVGAFPPHLGRVGNRLVSGEERYVMTELVAAGFKTRFDGRICVEHMIQPQRLHRSWIRNRSMMEGAVTYTFHSRRQRLVTSMKCALGMPILLTVARCSQDPVVEIRYAHNLGYLKSVLSRAFGG